MHIAPAVRLGVWDRCPRRLVRAALVCLGLPSASVGVVVALALRLVVLRLLLGCGVGGHEQRILSSHIPP